MKARSVTVCSSAVPEIRIFLKQNSDDLDDNNLKGFLGLGSDFSVKLITKNERKIDFFFLYIYIAMWDNGPLFLSLSGFNNTDVGVVWINVIIKSICFYCSLYYNSFSG